MPVVRWCRWQHTWFSTRRQEFESPTDCHAVAAQCRQCVQLKHGMPMSGSSVGSERRSDNAEAGGSIPPRTTRSGALAV
jgi:hypothetical protein